MQQKFRLYRRSNRSHGTYYAHDCVTGKRESLGTKDRKEAEKLLQAKNETLAQPAFNREMAKVYLRAQDPAFCQRTWTDVANMIDAVYEGSTRRWFAKFIKSVPMKALVRTRLIDTAAGDFLAALGHDKAGVSTNVQLRILHNRALDLGWLLHPVLSRKAWPEIRYAKRRGITLEEHRIDAHHEITSTIIRTREMPAHDLVGHRQPALMRAVAALDTRLLAHPTLPLVGAYRRVTRTPGLRAHKPPRIHLRPPAEQRAE